MTYDTLLFFVRSILMFCRARVYINIRKGVSFIYAATWRITWYTAQAVPYPRRVFLCLITVCVRFLRKGTLPIFSIVYTHIKNTFLRVHLTLTRSVARNIHTYIHILGWYHRGISRESPYATTITTKRKNHSLLLPGGYLPGIQKNDDIRTAVPGRIPIPLGVLTFMTM
jgi:hypothetical protein